MANYSQKTPEDASTSSDLRENVPAISAEKKRALRRLYETLDIDKNGRVDIKELTSALKNQNLCSYRQSARRIMNKADTDRSHDLDFDEFVSYVLEHERKLGVIFSDLDKNSDGTVDLHELKSYCKSIGVPLTDRTAKRILNKMDSDRNAAIDLEEFQRFFRFCPGTKPEDLASFWKHSLAIDIGENLGIPDDFSEEELASGIWWKNLVAGGVAGAVSRTFTAPMERLRVYIQVHGKKYNFSGVQGIKSLVKEGGCISLWRGNGVNVLKIGPESALKFFAYEKAKTLILLTKNDENPISNFERFIAGTMAGICAQTCVYPLETMKTRLALRKTGDMNDGLIKAAKQIYQREGLRAFYRGYIPGICSIIPYAGTDLVIFENLRNFSDDRFIQDRHNQVALLVCSSLSTTCGQLASYPLALVRTRLQARTLISDANQPKNMIGQIRTIWENEGFFGFFRGISPNFVKVIPAVAASWIVYETVRKQLLLL